MHPIRSQILDAATEIGFRVGSALQIGKEKGKTQTLLHLTQTNHSQLCLSVFFNRELFPSDRSATHDSSALIRPPLLLLLPLTLPPRPQAAGTSSNTPSLLYESQEPSLKSEKKQLFGVAATRYAEKAI